MKQSLSYKFLTLCLEGIVSCDYLFDIMASENFQKKFQDARFYVNDIIIDCGSLDEEHNEKLANHSNILGKTVLSLC